MKLFERLPHDTPYTVRRIIIIFLLFGWVGILYDLWIEKKSRL